jgi:hypothetical protein
MKTCLKCGVELTIVNAYKRGNDFYSYCKSCKCEMQRRYNQTIGAKEISKKRRSSIRGVESQKNHNDWRRKRYKEDLEYRERIKLHSIENRNKHKEKYAIQSKHRRHDLWNRAVLFFGGCECCGETHIEFLAIDHIHGNGNELRRNGERAGANLLSIFDRGGWSESIRKTYRLLCHNCNNAIARYGYCPHKTDHNNPNLF